MTDDDLLAAVEYWGALDRAQLERLRQVLAETALPCSAEQEPRR